MLEKAADHPAFGEAISNRLAELAALSDEPGRLTRLYLARPPPRHRSGQPIGCATPECRCGSIRWRASSAATKRGTAARRRCMLGSHIDSVRNAGRFDGPLGVVTAIEVVKAAFRSGKRFPFAIEVIAFGDEEGVRFASTLGGSRALAGTFDEKALDELDENAISRREALADLRLRSVARRCREALRRTGPSAMSKCTSSKARCWKRKACRSASSPRSTA